MPILHPSAVLGRNPPTKYSQFFFGSLKGGQKTGKNQCFLVVSCAVFCFLYRLLMVTCRLDKPSCLQMCHSSLVSHFSCYVFSFFPVVVFPCFYSFLFFLGSYFFIWLFVFLVFSIGGTETQMKPQNISKFSLSSSASVPASPHFHLARIITRLGQQKNFSKNLFFCCLYAWSISNVLKYLFLLCFYTSSKCCLQNGPQEKR